MGLLAETVTSVSGAQVTTDEVTFQLSRALALLPLPFSTQGFDAPGSRWPPASPVLATSLYKVRTPCSLQKASLESHSYMPPYPILEACVFLSFGTSRKA